ncbi:uncharacterized protein SETTUDRAFT_167061, partial [Exserohilum turcica Et28A]
MRPAQAAVVDARSVSRAWLCSSSAPPGVVAPVCASARSSARVKSPKRISCRLWLRGKKI